MADLVALLPAKQRAWVPTVEPPPPAGLVPIKPSFNTVAEDVLMLGGRVVRISGGPMRPLHAIECMPLCEEFCGTPEPNVIVWPQQRPDEPGGDLLVRRLLPAKLVNETSTWFENVDRLKGSAWELGEHELMLTDHFFEVSPARATPAVPPTTPHPLSPSCRSQVEQWRFIRPILVLSDLTYTLGITDNKTETRALAKVHLVDNKLCTVEEPSTTRTAISNLVNDALAVQPNLIQSTQKLLRNETRIQCTIEKQERAAHSNAPPT